MDRNFFQIIRWGVSVILAGFVLSQCGRKSPVESPYDFTVPPLAPNAVGTLYLTMPSQAETFFRNMVGPDSNFVIHYVDVELAADKRVSRHTNVRCNLHGQSSTFFPRKSYELKLESDTRVFHAPFSMDEFFLIAMEQDTGYVNNYIGLSIIKAAGLFHSHFEYVRVFINENYEGIYLLVEKSQNAVRERFQGVATVFRRNYGQAFEEKYQNQDYSTSLAHLNGLPYKIYELSTLYRGRELYDTLTQFFDLKQYCDWLAINAVLQNGDYTDEVFFYALEEPLGSGRFMYHVSGWDYEDILQPPHWDNGLPNSLVYTGEDSLDVVVANDPVLYSLYLERLGKTLDSLVTPAFLDSLKEKVSDAILPFFEHQETAEIMTNFPVEGDNSKAALAQWIQSRFDRIHIQRVSLATRLSSAL